MYKVLKFKLAKLTWASVLEEKALVSVKTFDTF